MEAVRLVAPSRSVLSLSRQSCSAIGSIPGVTTRYWHTARQCRTLLPTFSGEQLSSFHIRIFFSISLQTEILDPDSTGVGEIITRGRQVGCLAFILPILFFLLLIHAHVIHRLLQIYNKPYRIFSSSFVVRVRPFPLPKNSPDLSWLPLG